MAEQTIGVSRNSAESPVLRKTANEIATNVCRLLKTPGSPKFDEQQLNTELVKLLLSFRNTAVIAQDKGTSLVEQVSVDAQAREFWLHGASQSFAEDIYHEPWSLMTDLWRGSMQQEKAEQFVALMETRKSLLEKSLSAIDQQHASEVTQQYIEGLFFGVALRDLFDTHIAYTYLGNAAGAVGVDVVKLFSRLNEIVKLLKTHFTDSSFSQDLSILRQSAGEYLPQVDSQ